MAREIFNWLGAALIVAVAAGCGSKHPSGFGAPPGGGGGGGGSGNSGGGSGLYISPGNGSGSFVVNVLPGGDADASSDAEAPDPNCAPGVHTTVSGVVYDPGLQDP